MRELQRDYAARIVPPPAIVELAERRRLPSAALKSREAELILAAIPTSARVIALDPRGAPWSSEDFARRLGEWRDHGLNLAFAIGGADGLADAVLSRADDVLSLGAMTWPHFLARNMLLEQLYRTQQILAGHPYHRG